MSVLITAELNCTRAPQTFQFLICIYSSQTVLEHHRSFTPSALVVAMYIYMKHNYYGLLLLSKGTSPYFVQGDVWEVYHDIASYLLQTTSENVVGKKRRSPQKKTPKEHVYRTTSQLIQSTQPKVATRGLRAMSAGAVSRKLRSRVSLKGIPQHQGLKEPGRELHCSIL